jgi:hypothetical protein
VSITRKHLRIPYSGPVRISWEDQRGELNFAAGKCLDISKAGLQIELPVSIPRGTYLTLRADRINVSGTASVRNVMSKGSKYILGLELNAPLRDDAIVRLTDPAPAIETVRRRWAD